MEIETQSETPSKKIPWTPEQRRSRLFWVTAALVVGIVELLWMIAYQSINETDLGFGGVGGTAMMIPVWIAVMSMMFAYVVKRGSPSQKQEQAMKATIVLLMVLMVSSAGLAVALGII